MSIDETGNAERSAAARSAGPNRSNHDGPPTDELGLVVCLGSDVLTPVYLSG
jgi:hypothetical protein